MIAIERSAGVTFVALSGEFDLANVPRLEAALANVAFDETVVVDLANVTYVDSTLLNALVRRHKKAQAPFVVIVPSASPVRRIFTLTNLHEFMRVVPDRACARAFLRDANAVTNDPGSTPSDALADTDSA